MQQKSDKKFKFNSSLQQIVVVNVYKIQIKSHNCNSIVNLK